MNTTHLYSALMLAALLALAGCERESEPVPPTTPPTPTTDRTGAADAVRDADNTARNERDAEFNTRTPLDQSESSEHVRITAEIRKAIMDDDNLSVNAQNCKVITDASGTVTLRGVVESQAEKDAIHAKAAAIAGANNIANQLEVKLN